MNDRIDRYYGIKITNQPLPSGREVQSAVEQVDDNPSNYYLKINANFYINAIVVNSCYARYCNDNKDVANGNNSEFEIEPDEDSQYNDKGYLVATKIIKVDEEIFVDYGNGYWNQPLINNTQTKSKSGKTVKNEVVSSSSTQQNKKQKK